MYPNPRDDPKGVETPTSSGAWAWRFFVEPPKQGASWQPGPWLLLRNARLCSKKTRRVINACKARFFVFSLWFWFTDSKWSGRRVIIFKPIHQIWTNLLKWHPDSYASFRSHRFQISLLSTYFLEQQSTEAMIYVPSNLPKETMVCVPHFVPTTS